LNGLDKGSAYALIALGLTLIFGTLGVVNFAHGALFMLGAFCAVTLNALLTLSYERSRDPRRLSRQSAQGRRPYPGLVRSRFRRLR
jgi:branched-chain amino acid transport system permease protein